MAPRPGLRQLRVALPLAEGFEEQETATPKAYAAKQPVIRLANKRSRGTDPATTARNATKRTA